MPGGSPGRETVPTRWRRCREPTAAVSVCHRTPSRTIVLGASSPTSGANDTSRFVSCTATTLSRADSERRRRRRAAARRRRAMSLTDGSRRSPRDEPTRPRCTGGAELAHLGDRSCLTWRRGRSTDWSTGPSPQHAIRCSSSLQRTRLVAVNFSSLPLAAAVPPGLLIPRSQVRSLPGKAEKIRDLRRHRHNTANPEVERAGDRARDRETDPSRDVGSTPRQQPLVR